MKIDDLVSLIVQYNKDGTLAEHGKEIMAIKKEIAKTMNISELNNIINLKIEEYETD